MNRDEMISKLEKITIFGMGSKEEGLAICEQALKANPDDTKFILFKTNCLVALARYSEAIPLFDILIEKEPASAHIYKQRKAEIM